MGYYRVCEICGANLDPGERCSDCYPAQDDNSRLETTARATVWPDMNYLHNGASSKKGRNSTLKICKNAG